MVALKLQNFGGMIPAVDPHLLPPNSAELAQNTWVHTGAIQGFPGLTKVYDPVSSSTQKVFRVPIDKVDVERITGSYWIEFSSPNTDIVRSPTSGDQFERYYFAADNREPRYNTRARVAAGLPDLKLGVPAPGTAPGVVAGGGAAPLEARAYVYTWVTEFGEEGPPSPPTLITANTSGTWDITLTAPGGATTDRLLDKVRIYRTVSGVGGETDYFFVAEQDIALTTYTDVIASVTNNPLLQSIFWNEPPVDLQGMTSMPNGIIAGFKDNEIWFCEPYRPHAWPAPYQLSVDAKIVGCGVIGQSLIVCTEGSPYAISGVNPSSMSQSRLAQFEPCTARGSIVSTPAGVAYSSPNGLVLAVASGAVIFTKQMLQREDWSNLLYLPTIHAATFNSGYYAFGSTAIGCFSASGFDTDAFLQQDFTGAFTGAFIDPNDSRVAVSKLESAAPVRSVYTDHWTGEVLVHTDEGVFLLDQARGTPRQPYIWRSKILETPAQSNFEAMRVYFTPHAVSPELNPVQDVSQDQELKPDQWGLVRLYADGRLCFTRELRTSGEYFRLPSGFKATMWQIEIEGRVRIDSIEIASTARELGRV